MEPDPNIQDTKSRVTSTASAPSISTPVTVISTLTNHIISFVQRIKKHPFIIFILILVAIIGVLGLRYTMLTKESVSEQSPQYFKNVLLVLDAELDSQTAPKSLKVRFNNPVDVHELSHFATFSPIIPGEW